MWKIMGAAVVVAGLSPSAHGETTVQFDHPERFLDVQDVDRSAESNLAILRAKLVGLGQRYLSPDDDLRITITNVDLAGRLDAGGSTAPNPRVMNGNADWPRIALRYTETRRGQVVGPIDEVLVDQNYLAFESTITEPTVPLYFEQRMLERWFKERFVDRRPPPRRSGRRRF